MFASIQSHYFSKGVVFCTLFFTLLFPVLKADAKGNVVSASYKVDGVCEQCKKRIEDASYEVKGVRFAEWNVDTHILSLRYDSTKVSPLEILKKVAEAGHDNELVKATNSDYDRLPHCCRYREGIKKH